MSIYFDLETAPLADAELEKVKPVFKAPSNYVDPEKIARSIKEQEESWKERAALNALTGQILALGMIEDGAFTAHTHDEETSIITFFETFKRGDNNFVGFCIKSFDLQMIFQRAIIKGLPVPPSLMEGRYWSSRFIDLQERWLCFGRDHTGASLDAICKACGIGAKNGNGAEFAKLFDTDWKKAIKYLENDLTITAKLAERLGIQ